MNVSISEAPQKDYAAALSDYIIGASEINPLENGLPTGTQKEITKTIRTAARYAMRDPRYLTFVQASNRLGLSMAAIKTLPSKADIKDQDSRETANRPWDTETARIISKQLMKAGACSSTPKFFIDVSNEKKAEFIARAEKARGVCSTCVVLIPCAEYSILYEEPHGILAGATEKGRSMIASSVVDRLAMSIPELRQSDPMSEVRVSLREEILPALVGQEHLRQLGSRTEEREGDN